MDTVQWPQEIVVKPLEEIVTNTCPKPLPPRLPQSPPRPTNSSAATAEIRKARPQKDQAVNCPRCNSTNTKFCYYNNYSLSQPRYFCKTCRRYWTAGGSLRNIPVGGGSRKNKRSSSSTTSLSTNSSSQPPKKQIITSTSSLTGQNPRFHDHPQDLNLGFPHGYRSNFTDMIQNIANNNNDNDNNKNSLLVANGSCSTTSSTITSTHISGLDLLNGNNNNNNSFMGFPIHNYHHHHHHQQDPSGFVGNNNMSMQDFNKPTTLLGFSLDGINGGSDQGFHQQLSAVQEEAVNNGRSLFPFEDLKLPLSSSSNGDQIETQKQQGDASAGYWTGMLSGGSW